MIKVRPAMRLV